MFDSFKSPRSLIGNLLREIGKAVNAVMHSAQNGNIGREIAGKMNEDILFIAEYQAKLDAGNAAKEDTTRFIRQLEAFKQRLMPEKKSKAFDWFFQIPEAEQKELLAILGNISGTIDILTKKLK